MTTSDTLIAETGKNIQEKATLIWNVANTLFGAFKPHEYGLVILPMVVIKRFHDCLLAYVDNEVLIRTIHFLTRRISKFLILPHWLHAYSLDEARARHADLLETIKTRRPEAVRAAILEHYRQLGLKIVSRMS